MAIKVHKNKTYPTSCMVFLMMVFTQILTYKFVDGTKTSYFSKAKYTIEDEDDEIECVDIYKQPAFSHPLLKNHVIQMRPSSYLYGPEERNHLELLQMEGGICPEGTIPIARTTLTNHSKVSPLLRNKTLPALNAPGHEYAQVTVEGGRYYGAHAKFNVWNPAVTNDGEFSLSQFWILAGRGQDLNTIEAGWHVLSGVHKPRIFIYWTRDNYQNTGCYNLDCPGFVQTSRKVALGAPISRISTYNGKQYEIEYTVHKDKRSGNWWLQFQGIDLGYWPASIFTSLAESGTSINWGGEIVNNGVNGRHTSTQMGSGHFPGEGFHKAAVLFNLGYIDNSGALRDPENLVPFVSKPSCYDLLLGNKGAFGFGVHFYFGGPGFSPNCT